MRDIVNQLEQKAVLLATISVNGTIVGTGVDTADDELGLMFTMNLSSYTDGSHILGAEESDDDGATDPYTTVSSDNYCNTPVAAAAATGANAMTKLGVFGTKRWVRPTITSTGVTTGTGATAFATQKAELKPTP